jgi:death-on-curing protein
MSSGHVFNDANKRTALTCALTYLYRQGIQIPRVAELEEVVVLLAAGEISGAAFADFLSAVWLAHDKPTVNAET